MPGLDAKHSNAPHCEDKPDPFAGSCMKLSFLEQSGASVVQLSASLWRSTEQIVAQRVFRSELPAQTPDARGAVVCLASAVNLESDEIVEWLSAEIAGTPSGDPARR
jgi:hypothetical protein